MTPSAITLDVAGTLVDTRWNPARAIEEAATRIGIEVPTGAGDAYAASYVHRLTEFHSANLESDARVEKFWIQLDADWLTDIGHDASRANTLYDSGCELLFGPKSEVFQPFADAEPALRRLRDAAIPLVVVSNWDNSLKRVLTMFGWMDYFELVIPSLVFGHEKPDPRIFYAALNHLGVPAEEVLHVGDNPIDDLQGARGIGMRAVLVDRDRTTNIRPYIKSLDDLEEVYEWTD